MQSGQRLKNHASPSTWKGVQQRYNSASRPATLPASEDQADALVAWYGLTSGTTAAGLSTAALMSAQAASPGVVSQEGWIFGV